MHKFSNLVRSRDKKLTRRRHVSIRARAPFAPTFHSRSLVGKRFCWKSSVVHRAPQLCSRVGITTKTFSVIEKANLSSISHSNWFAFHNCSSAVSASPSISNCRAFAYCPILTHVHKLVHHLHDQTTHSRSVKLVLRPQISNFSCFPLVSVGKTRRRSRSTP